MLLFIVNVYKLISFISVINHALANENYRKLKKLIEILKFINQNRNNDDDNIIEQEK